MENELLIGDRDWGNIRAKGRVLIVRDGTKVAMRGSAYEFMGQDER